MSETFDVVVAGGGHNSLVTAAYLAKAGYDVVVLEARDSVGGGATTEELTLPGFRFDSCSTGHTLIQPNPLLRDDELGLKGRYGLEYVRPDPIAHVVFPDGESFTHWLDLDRACDEIARFSRRDADEYRRNLAEFADVREAVGSYRFNPIGYVPSLEEQLRDRPRWLRRIAATAYDVVRREYQDPHVRSYVLWQAFQTAQPVDSPGSGLLAYSIVAGRQSQSWTLPLGGSGALALALERCLEDLGATIVTGSRVDELVVEGGRCVGVVTDDGERYLARRAVVSTIHVKQLVEMAPRDAWDDDFLDGIETYDPGISIHAQYYATTEPPRFVGPAGPQTAVSGGVVGWPEDVLQAGRDVREGKLLHARWLLIATPTLDDPSRAPEGGHTVKLLSMCPWDPGEGPEQWEALKHEVAEENYAAMLRAAPNMTHDVVLAELVKSPVDIQHHNEHMWHGTIHGGDRGYANDGPRRPAPGWAQHRMPIPGLYQTGATTHPGGSITGAPGRNCAIVLLDDLGHSAREVMAGVAPTRA
ncbi:MAG TPA: NAD(P)/FAD-dependent oxidoreductase [Gaiellaceae bacterium]|nr:NAD(P)/FAD-dependent oxidoreductase [Gaiellaceae bacterium]